MTLSMLRRKAEQLERIQAKADGTRQARDWLILAMLGQKNKAGKFKWTQEQIAAAAGVTSAYVRKLDRERRADATALHRVPV